MLRPRRAVVRDRTDYAYPVPEQHAASGARIRPPFPEGLEQAVFALGCFWGAERVFWQLPGVYSTAAGYTAGDTPYPTYEEVCGGETGHAEAVLVVYDPEQVTYAELLRAFWEAHDPTQGNRQGNDVGTQYRSGVYVANDEQRRLAEASKAEYARALAERNYGPVTTEIAPLGEFFYAEDYHQQYLHKVPWGYCGLGGTGVSCPAPATAAQT